MDNNCVKLYPDRAREYEVMSRTRCEQTERQTDGRTDRQTDRVIPIYSKLCLRGYKKLLTDQQCTETGHMTMTPLSVKCPDVYDEHRRIVDNISVI